MNTAAIANEVGRKVGETKVFSAAGDFNAYTDAKGYVSIKNFQVGSMQRSAPIGFKDADVCCGISKWRNMTPSERKTLDGVIVADSFRHGPVTVIFFLKSLERIGK